MFAFIQWQRWRDNQRRLPFWAKQQSWLVNAIHQPDPAYKEIDGLLEDLDYLRITEPNRLRLNVLINKAIADPGVPKDKQTALKVLLLVMPEVIKEEAGELGPEDKRSIEQKKGSKLE